MACGEPPWWTNIARHSDAHSMKYWRALRTGPTPAGTWSWKIIM